MPDYTLERDRENELRNGMPIPLRKVPFITGWSVDELADFLTDMTLFDFRLLTPYEWLGQESQHVVPVRTMVDILEGIKDDPDVGAKLARFPAHFFVYEAELECAFDNTCNPELYAGYEGRCPFHLDWNPSFHPYEDLIGECPDFSPPPSPPPPPPPLSQRDSRTQTTEKRDVELNEKAKALRANNPNKSETWIADRMVINSEAEGLNSETIRKIIRTK